MKSPWLRRAAVAAITVALLWNGSAWPVLAADDLDDYREQLDKLSGQLLTIQKQREDVQAQIAGARTEKERKLVEKLYFEEQIALTRGEIEVLNERIALLEEQIDAKSREITDKQSDIDLNFERYQKRLRANYMAGESSKLAMILGASDFTDFLMRGEIVRATAKHDQQLVDQLREDRLALEEDKAELDKSKRAVESDHAQMAQKHEELEGQLNATQTAIQDISLMEQEYLSRAAELDEMDKKVQAELDRVYATIDNSGEFVGGIFSWPVPGYPTITSYYGLRFGNTNFHTGIDISGSKIYGKSIKASNSGVVAYVQTAYTDGVGYGIHVIVNHGGGYTTLYGHMSSVSVSVGDRVTREITEIGKIGSTGWSTGPHLHFEVRVDGKHQNPLGFLKSKG